MEVSLHQLEYSIHNVVDNFNKGIPRHISNIKFPFLVDLCLLRNSIESVEALSRMLMPKLAKINLGEGIMMKARTASAASKTSGKLTGLPSVSAPFVLKMRLS